ncbi:hypothetical protein IRJ41_023632 [Triplophysa rosa]|uniref:Uncharacterized protein n=1 Tax=Triplophysa rosa TaxID=992332 RepID=A0A9W7X684_TRIRA|nr:hypothetical protein IRJ41_023632 [Triplophysa rosa]
MVQAFVSALTRVGQREDDIPELPDVRAATLAIRRLIHHEPPSSVFVWVCDRMHVFVCLLGLAALHRFVNRSCVGHVRCSSAGVAGLAVFPRCDYKRETWQAVVAMGMVEGV